MITPIYVAVFALLLIALSLRTILSRVRAQVAVGPGEDMQLLRAMRVQANFCEYIPMALIALFFVESLWGSTMWIHVMGGSLVLARVLHAYGVAQVKENLRFRQVGMAITFSVIASSALAIFANYLVAP